MNTLADLPLRAQTLAGQIKQADADVAECDVQRARAEKALALAQANSAKAIERAAALRADRDAMRADADKLLGMVGEPTPVAGEEVSISAGAGGDDQTPPPATCEHVWNYHALDDRFVCSQCGDAMSKAQVDTTRGISAVRRVSF